MTNNDNSKKDNIEIDPSNISSSIQKGTNGFVKYVVKAFSEVFGFPYFEKCPNCNKKNTADSNYCIYCGTKIVEDVQDITKDASGVEHKTVKVNKKAITIVGIVVVVGVVAVIALSVLGVFKQKISVLTDDYIAYKGANEYGKAYINSSSSVGNEFIEYYYADTLDDEFDEKAEAYEAVFYNIVCEIQSENNGHLRNGDEVKVACGYEQNSEKMVEEALDIIGVKLVDTERTYIVSGLEDVPTVDFFEGVTTGWVNGWWGTMELDIDIDNQYKDKLYYSHEYNEETGDLRLWIDESAESLIEKLGVIGDTEKTIHVGKTPVLITSLDSEELKQEAEKIGREGIDQNAIACGSEVYPYSGDLQSDLIVSKDVVDIKDGSTISVEFNVVCEHDEYKRTISFNMYQYEDGTYGHTFTSDLTSCAAKDGVWR